MIDLQFIEKECKVCHNIRKFVKDTPRDEHSVCGNCWPWPQVPEDVEATPDELSKVREMLQNSV